MSSQDENYKAELKTLQIELTRLQRHIIQNNHKILVIFEGRDASGKDGVIKRITRHMSPREVRVVALGKPTLSETQSWYYQRYVDKLPSTAEMVLFNRSWYNRAGVEKVMGYCTEEEHKTFFETVNDFESLLIRSGIDVLKYYLDISKDEQIERLAERKTSPLTQWKTSPVDAIAVEKWDEYSRARNEMLRLTHTNIAPWAVVKANNKKAARLNIIRDLLNRVNCPRTDEHCSLPDAEIVSLYQGPSQLNK